MVSGVDYKSFKTENLDQRGKKKTSRSNTSTIFQILGSDNCFFIALDELARARVLYIALRLREQKFLGQLLEMFCAAVLVEDRVFG